MAPVLIQAAPLVTASGSVATAIFNSTVGNTNDSGELRLILVYVVNTNSAYPPPVTAPVAQTAGGATITATWALIQGQAGTGYWAGIYAVLIPGSASMKKVVLTWNTGSAGEIYCEEYSGIAYPLTWAKDTVTSLSHSSTASTATFGTAISPSSGTELLVSLVATTAANGTSSSVAPTWTGTPALSLGLGYQGTYLFTGNLVTNTASALPAGNWPTSRAWIQVTSYFRASYTGTGPVQPSAARISLAITGAAQPAGALIAAPVSASAQPATAAIGASGSVTVNRTTTAAAVISVTPTPTLNANAVLSYVGTNLQPTSGAIAGPPFSPQIFMGPGNNLTEALSTSYFALSGDIDGANAGVYIGGATGWADSFTFVIDGGKAT